MDRTEEHPAASELIGHAVWLRRLALALVGDAATADDVVQEAFVAALSRPPAGGRMPRTWLARVVRNAAKQSFRSQARRDRREAESSGPAPVPGPDETTERLDTERRLTDELARLDEPFRTTLMLRYYDGFAPAEIARRTGTPGGTVRWRLQRGLELLRERLDGRFGERTAWCALLLPFARSQPPVVAGAAASTIVLSGALTMSALLKLGTTLACVLAIAIGLMMGGVLPDSLLPFAREAPLEVAFRPLAPRDAVPPEVESIEPTVDGGARREAVPDVPSAAVATPGSVAEPARVEARVVDSAGVPLAGVELRELDGPGRVARSAADGRVVLLLALDRSRGVALEFRSPGYASHGERPVLAAGEVAYLGTVVLEPGGVVSGRVLDAAGAAVDGARVTFAAASETRRALEGQRVQGGFASVPKTETDAQGRFELVGLDQGFVRVCAEAPDFLASFTPPVEVRAGQETYGIELRLDRLPRENLLRGIVLDPDGAPVTHARLEFRHESRSTGTVSSGDRRAGADGRFEFRLPNDARLSLVAHDPAGRFGTASAEDARTGGPELVLRLLEASRIALVVRGAEGQAVEEYGFEVLSAAGVSSETRSVHEREARAPRPDGATVFRVPTDAFTVAIDAPGYESELLGPFDPERVAASLEARLVPVPGLHGRVLLGRDEAPAAGARVNLLQLVEEDVEYLVDGFPSRLQGDPVDGTSCDSEGRFLLTVRRAGEYVVRAERPGRAPAESPVLVVGRDLRARDVELVLGVGGAIEGRVVRADGGDPTGTILGLARGDGFGRTLRVGPGGRYRFEHLTPGPWWLEVRSEELQPGSRSISSGRGTGQATRGREPTCEVFEGETTWHDLELGGPSACALEGRLRIDGAPAPAWNARLVPHDRAFFSDEEDDVAVDVEGRFRIEADRPGQYWLVLSGAFEEHGEQFVVDVVELARGVAHWEHELTTGALVVEGATAWTGEDLPGCVHIWKGPDELFALTVISGNEDGVARVPSLPAGPGRLVRPDPTHFDFSSWPTLLEVQVPAGGEARVRMP